MELCPFLHPVEADATPIDATFQSGGIPVRLFLFSRPVEGRVELP